MVSDKIEPSDLFVQPNSRARRPLISWMMQNHDELLALISHHRISWQFATERFTSAGYTAASNRPLKAETVRSYWIRAQKYVARERVVAAKQIPSTPTQSPPAAPPAATTQATGTKGFLPVEPETSVDPDDIFSRPLPTVQFRHQARSPAGGDAERVADKAREALAKLKAPKPPKSKD